MRKYSRIKGFTIIEVAVSIAVLSVILGGVLGMFWQGELSLKKSRENIAAYNLARERLEEYSNTPLASNGTTTEDYNFIVDYPQFKRVTVVSDYTYPGELKRINVTVYWNTDLSSLSFETLKADY